jgi:hypothetical protein
MIKQKRIKIASWAIIISLLLFLGLYFSFRKARMVADDLILPVKDELSIHGTSFSLVNYDGTQINGPSWIISYEPNDQMIIAPIRVEVSLLGQMTKTTPKNLRDWIIKKEKQE